MADAPTLLPVQVDTIPADLRAMDRWVLWNLETRDSTPTKVPYQAKYPAAKADATNANTWADFATARDAYQDGKADGLGLVLGDGVFGPPTRPAC
jgi:primase-polymerase (primpol)-like protein